MAVTAERRVIFSSPRFWVLLVGVILVVVSSFAQIPVPLDPFKFGCGLCFASFLG